MFPNAAATYILGTLCRYAAVTTYKLETLSIHMFSTCNSDLCIYREHHGVCRFMFPSAAANYMLGTLCRSMIPTAVAFYKLETLSSHMFHTCNSDMYISGTALCRFMFLTAAATYISGTRHINLENLGNCLFRIDFLPNILRRYV